MRVRDAVEADLAWAPEYILDGFEHDRYVPSAPRIEQAIRACMACGLALVAEQAREPVGVLGAVVHPIFWAERDEVSVLAWRSTHPGAGLRLLRALLARLDDRPDIKQIVVTVAPENTDPRLPVVMQRMGATLLRSFLFVR